MKLLGFLERCRDFWFLFILSFLFFLLRLPSFFEPNWYGDEAIYEVIGSGMRHGRLLYSGIFDNKPPLLYITYALFSGDQTGARVLSFFAALLALIFFYFLIKRNFTSRPLIYVLTASFAILTATPLVEGNIANAENFMMLPILLALLLILQFNDKKKGAQSARRLFFAGLLLSIAFLYKIVAIFDFGACAFFIIVSFLTIHKEKKHITLWIDSIRRSFPSLLYLAIGFLLPIGITCLWFIFQGNLLDFIGGAFSQNVGYVGYGNRLFIPQGFLILKLILLAIFLLLIAYNKKRFTGPAMLTIIWFAFSVFNAYFSQRPYTHYALVALPSFILVLGYVYILFKTKPIYALLLVFGLFLLAKNFNYYSLKKTFLYYPNFLFYVFEQKNTISYMNFFDADTSRNYDVAMYLKNKSRHTDNFFMWGNSAMIYVLADRLPPGKYTVAYHINNKTAIKETEKSLKMVNPKFIVILPGNGIIPFHISQYSYKLSIQNAQVYERIN